MKDKQEETAMNKKYKAIFFDWDGTAVTSRTAPVEDAVAAMKPLLQQGTKLVTISSFGLFRSKSPASTA